MPGYLEQLIDYDIWATQRLLDVLRASPPPVLEATVPGVYGSTLETLTHLLDAEQSYVARLRGTPPPDEPPRLPLPEVEALAREVHESLRLLAVSLPEPTVEYQRRLGPATAATVLTQLFQHGCDHRSQICTILGANGIEPPRMDPWAHGRVLAGLPPL